MQGMDAITQAQTFATTGAMEAWSFVLSFLALLIIAAVLFGFALRYGKSALLALVIALYAGYALYVVFPYSDAVLAIGAGSALMLFIAKLVMYAILTYIPYYLIRRYGGHDYAEGHRLFVLLAAFLAAAFIIAIGYHTLGAKAAYSFTPAIDNLFAPAKYFFWWFIAPLAGVYLLVR